MKQVLPLKLSTKDDNAHKVKRSVSPHQQVPILAPPQSHTQHHHAGIAALALAQSDELKHNLVFAAFLILVLIEANKRVAFSTWANLTPPSHIPLCMPSLTLCKHRSVSCMINVNVLLTQTF